MIVIIHLKNWLNSNWFLFGFKIIKDAFENIGVAVTRPSIQMIGAIFQVWKEAVSFNEAHKSNLTNYFSRETIFINVG